MISLVFPACSSMLRFQHSDEEKWVFLYGQIQKDCPTARSEQGVTRPAIFA
jgi:hypothetical protein